MKTSKKIIITTAIFLITLWIVTLFVVRKDIRTILAARNLVEYQPVPVEKFSRLVFSDNWTVTVRQGKDCGVELGALKGGHPVPGISNVNGTLHLSCTTHAYARITAPSLQVIQAAGNTSIDMKNFWSDSLIVILGDSSSFTGRQNDFKYISFKASEIH
jgi:hypothetical protein